MNLGSVLESTGMLLAVLTPLVVVPLTVITFYLRALRDHQISRHAELVRRMESVEASAGDIRKTLSELERDYTTKEEWLRECMYARRALGQLSEAAVRMETTLGAFRQSGIPGGAWVTGRSADVPTEVETPRRSGGECKDGM